MSLRQFIPRRMKIAFQLSRRWIRYHLLRRDIQYANTTGQLGQARINLRQAVRKSHLYENKLANLKLAGTRVSSLVIQPGEVFSFWRVVGPPRRKYGFKKGRNLIGGKLQEDYGGGLCQLSGLVYHLSLLAGLEIVERHHHSVDIYTDDQRFTPLGADATVVYGYKDLQLRNCLPFAIQFDVHVGPDCVDGNLRACENLSAHTIRFQGEPAEADRKAVMTLRGDGTVIARSVYRS